MVFTQIRSIFFSAAVWLAFTASINAQFGIKIGGSLSGFITTHSESRYISGEDLKPFLGYEVDWLQHGNYYPNINLQAGIFYNFKIDESFSLQPELYYARREMRTGFIDLYNSYYSIKINYLQVPLLAKYQVHFGSGFNPSIIAGPYLAFSLNSNFLLFNNGRETERSLNNVNTLDYGIIFGLDSEFNIFQKIVGIEARINWGFAGIMKQPENHTPLFDDPGRISTVSFNLLFSYNF